MKKILLTLSMLAGYYAASAQGNDITMPFINTDLRPACDSTVEEIPNGATYKFNSAIVFKLNSSSGFMESMLMYDTNKVVAFKIDVFYTSNKATHAITNVNAGGSMLAYGSTYFTYDGNGNVTKETMMRNIPTVDTTETYEYTYDGSNRITQHIRSKKESGVWELTDKEVFTYNAAGMCNKATRYYYDNGNWVAERELNMTYNAANAETERIEVNLQTTQNEEKIVRILDASNKDIQKLSYDWVSNAWEHVASDSNTFVNSLRTESRVYRKQSGNWTYVERERCAEGNLPSSVRNYINSLGLIVYPNPATTEVNIMAPAAEISTAVYDLNGKSVTVPATASGNKTILNTSVLPSGIYFLIIRNGENTSKQKIVIQ
ncbi:MAG: T9SS type A sorting domain-containing protein [Bacteroidia bacterium]